VENHPGKVKMFALEWESNCLWTDMHFIAKIGHFSAQYQTNPVFGEFE